MFFACFVNTKTMKTDLYVINLSPYMQKNSRKRSKPKKLYVYYCKKGVYIVHLSDFAILPIIDESPLNYFNKNLKNFQIKVLFAHHGIINFCTKSSLINIKSR